MAVVPGGTWLRRLPAVRVARSYEAAWLPRDIAAGLVLTAVLVPVGMGYAEAAGLPAVTGLYATIVPLLAYAAVGPSRVLVFGPDSSLTPLIAATIVPLAGTDVDRLPSLAAALAILAGAIGVVAGLARLGFLTDLISLPIRYGYMNGIALLIVVGQLAKLGDLPGRPGGSDGLVDGVRTLVDGLRAGEANATSIALGAGALAVILAARRWAPRLPAQLVAVVAAIACVELFDLAGISLVGELPAGAPGFAVPELRAADLGPLLAGAAGIAVVSMTDTSVLSRTMATRRGEAVAPDDELMAIGVTNVAAGLFQGFPVSGSASRTPVAAEAGARTQLAGVVGALATLAVLLVAPGVFRNLPSSVLAAIVIAAATSLVDLRGLAELRRGWPGELVVSIAALAGIALVGVIPGIGIAIGISLLAFVQRAWAPHTAELVRVDGLKGYHDVRRHPEGRRIPDLALLRFDAPLFFANAGAFRREVLRLADAPRRRVRWVVVTAEPITDVDATAATMLAELLVERIGADRFYRTIGQAVKASVRATGAAWIDWEDRQPGPA